MQRRRDPAAAFLRKSSMSGFLEDGYINPDKPWSQDRREAASECAFW
jgi:hypothetical protein